MDRRNEPRVEANEPVVITELGPGRRSPMGGMIQDMSNSGLLVKLPYAIAMDTPVRVEASNMLLLGEVMRCETEGEGFRVGVLIRHSLRDLQDLENLNRALLGEALPGKPVGEQVGEPAAVPIIRE